jgi:hypothetical protein
MRELIKQQLKNCSYADLSHFDPATNTFLIPRYQKPHFALGNMYLVQVSGALVNNTSSVIAANYNNGTAPSFNYLKIFVSKSLGKMIYVDSIGFDPSTKQDINIMWSGWLPTEELTLISQVVL